MNIDKLVPNDFSGILSIKSKAITYENVFGYANIPNKRLNNFNTKFASASAGKAFTAAGILMLIEEEKLAFDSTINQFLTMDLKDIDPSITVCQLLNHTSGIPDYCDETIVQNYADIFAQFPNYKIRTSKDMIPLFIDLPMLYPKGDKFHYNNTGYVVLGLIIEAITGKPFDKYLEEKLFIPCGMQNTGYFEYDRLPANCANVYIYDKEKDEYYTNIYSTTAKGVGDGGAFTTASDIESFWRHLYSEKIIGKSLLEKMTASQTADSCYGLGLWLEKSDAGYIPYFQGYEPCVSFKSSYDFNKDLIITLISNKGDNVWELHRKILNLLKENAF